MNRISQLLTVALCCAVYACGGPARIVPDTTIKYHYVDSVRYVDSTILVPVPVEVVKDVVPVYDTLRMSTTLAQAVAYVDTTTHTLKGSLENRKEPLAHDIKWREKIVIRDSIKTVFVPVEVPSADTPRVPRFYGIAIIVLVVVSVILFLLLIIKMR